MARVPDGFKLNNYGQYVADDIAAALTCGSTAMGQRYAKVTLEKAIFDLLLEYKRLTDQGVTKIDVSYMSEDGDIIVIDVSVSAR